MTPRKPTQRKGFFRDLTDANTDGDTLETTPVPPVVTGPGGDYARGYPRKETTVVNQEYDRGFGAGFIFGAVVVAVLWVLIMLVLILNGKVVIQ